MENITRLKLLRKLFHAARDNRIPVIYIVKYANDFVRDFCKKSPNQSYIIELFLTEMVASVLRNAKRESERRHKEY